MEDGQVLALLNNTGVTLILWTEFLAFLVSFGTFEADIILVELQSQDSGAGECHK